jgi:hypothetical protein
VDNASRFPRGVCYLGEFVAVEVLWFSVFLVREAQSGFPLMGCPLAGGVVNYRATERADLKRALKTDYLLFALL